MRSGRDRRDRCATPTEAEVLYHAFRASVTANPCGNLSVDTYRSYVRELLDRVAHGEHTRPHQSKCAWASATPACAHPQFDRLQPLSGCEPKPDCRRIPGLHSCISAPDDPARRRRHIVAQRLSVYDRVLTVDHGDGPTSVMPVRHAVNGAATWSRRDLQRRCVCRGLSALTRPLPDTGAVASGAGTASGIGDDAQAAPAVVAAQPAVPGGLHRHAAAYGRRRLVRAACCVG